RGARGPSFVGGVGELVDERRAGGVADSASLLAGGKAEPDEQVALAGAGVAEQHDGFAGVEVGAGRERGDGRRVDRRGGGQVEVGQAFGAWEPRFGDATLGSSFSAFGDFGGGGLGKGGV